MAKNAKIRLRAGENIGSPAAEQDHEYLGACFVAMPLVDTIKDISSHRCLILGRTGAGKSAVLWHLEHTLNNVTRVDPKEASFEYVSNSTIIQYLSDLGVDLHVFYEYLWKHILAVHVIRECLGVRTEHSFRTMLGKIQSFVRRDQRKAAVVARARADRHGSGQRDLQRGVVGAGRAGHQPALACG